ncbi:MAG: hypothetical protein IPI46_04145 [Bacteroidetes bacterium]|nr:hypothetical protein [Bacteroidota bacterium]
MELPKVLVLYISDFFGKAGIVLDIKVRTGDFFEGLAGFTCTGFATGASFLAEALVAKPALVSTTFFALVSTDLAIGFTSAFLAIGLATGFTSAFLAIDLATTFFAAGLATGLATTFFATGFAIGFLAAGLVGAAFLATTGFAAAFLATGFAATFFATGFAAAFLAITGTDFFGAAFAGAFFGVGFFEAIA